MRMVAVSVLALTAGALVETSRAGQFFVCKDGSTIEIASDQLAKAKRENPCIAEHFGLAVTPAKPSATKPRAAKVKAAVEAARSRTADLKSAAEASQMVVLPVRKPQRTKLRSTDVAAPPRPAGAIKQRVAAAAGGDYRRVRVINARSPAGQWFIHKR